VAGAKEQKAKEEMTLMAFNKQHTTKLAKAMQDTQRETEGDREGETKSKRKRGKRIKDNRIEIPVSIWQTTTVRMQLQSQHLTL